MMKSKFFTISLFFLAISVYALENQKPATDTHNGAAVSAHSNSLERVGGLITRPVSGPAVLFLNTQKLLSASWLEEVARTIGGAARVKYATRLETTQEPVQCAKGLLVDKNFAVAVVLCDMTKQPTLLVAPEERWVLVNVAALAADGTTGEKLQERTEKELWRAMGFVFGSGYSNMFPSSVMKPVTTLQELDAISGKSFGMDSMQNVLKTMEAMGLKPVKRTSYKRACEEGWAPPPTNDIQKAVWEQVKGNKAVDKK